MGEAVSARVCCDVGHLSVMTDTRVRETEIQLRKGKI
jgi:hypothetical protein